MRTGAAANHQGYLHQAIPYASDDELLATAVPFLRGGIAAGEPTVVSVGRRTAELIASALGDADDVTFVEGASMYARPAAAIKAYQEMLAGYVAAGAGQIRIIGEFPALALGATWDSWARYESAVNHAYDDYPLWSMCAYDTRTTPGHVLADVARTHPGFATATGAHRPSPGYLEPARFLAQSRPLPTDPIQAGRAVLDLTDPSAAEARRAVIAAHAGAISAAELEDLVLAVSEVVTNGLRHGVAPVQLRAWVGDGRVVVAVSDRGPGPAEPFAGLVPLRSGSSGGLGLWLTDQLCSHVVFGRTAEGFTVRLTAGVPYTGLSAES